MCSKIFRKYDQKKGAKISGSKSGTIYIGPLIYGYRLHYGGYLLTKKMSQPALFTRSLLTATLSVF